MEKITKAVILLAGLVIYIVSKKIFKELEKLCTGVEGGYQFKDAMKNLLKKEKFYTCVLDTAYYDIGSKIVYLKANIDYALQQEELKEELNKYKKSK